MMNSITAKIFIKIIPGFLFLSLVGCIDVNRTAPNPVVMPSQTVEASQTSEPQAESDQIDNDIITPTPILRVETDPIIVVWHSLDGDQRLAFQEIIANFLGLNTNVKILPLYVPVDDLLPRVLAVGGTDEMPDIIIGPGEWGPIFYDAALITDLRTEISSDLFNDFNQPALGSVAYESAVIGLPFTIRGVIMYRNADIIPDPPKSFAELISSAQAAARGEIVGAYLERGDIYALGQMKACGTSLMYASGLPAFNTPKGVCWIELLQTFAEAGPTSFNSNQDFERFRSKRAGIIFDGTWNLEILSDSLGEALQIDPWPAYGDHNLSGYVWSDNIYVKAGLAGLQKDEALAFIRFLTASESQTILASWQMIPALANLEVASPNISQVMVALVQGSAYPDHPEFGVFFDPINTALDGVYTNEIEPQSALQQANDEIAENVRRNLAEKTEGGE